jgi:ABC-type multidrug transport system ATPase subunit
MKIELKEKYLALEPFTEIELPSFTVLTGLNGVGKTQILKAIFQRSIEVEGSEGQLIKYVTNHDLSEKESENPVNTQDIDLAKSIRMIKDVYSMYRSDGYQEGHYLKKSFEKIAKLIGKDVKDISDEDFERYLPLEVGFNSNSIFYENFKNIFFRYFLLVNQNDLFQAQSKKYPNNDITYLDEEKFINLYGESPWDFSNKVLTEASIPYRFKLPFGKKLDEKFDLSLENIHNHQNVNFSQMSSGEKVILSLVFAMYNSQLSLQFPSILLMDEPDASLHPSMIKHFLNVIKEVFVKEKKMNVIITTHSPTTIALSDEESIFTVEAGGKIIKKSKDEALKVLTEGVPSFSVNYENRRQIFVESPYDAEYYEELYKIYGDHLESEISLNFIPSGDVQKDKHGTGKNSCDVVKEVVKIMRDAGNSFIWGIIDYDDKNKSGDHLRVLGEERRYSTENYFFDPILLAVFLLIDDASKVPDIGLLPKETYLDIDKFESDRLQKIYDVILDMIKEKISSTKEGSQVCRLVNGKEVELPNWFLLHNGHDLEEIITTKVFTQMQGYKKGGDGDKVLKIAIIKRVIAIFPGLASEDLLQILKDVQG